MKKLLLIVALVMTAVTSSAQGQSMTQNDATILTRVRRDLHGSAYRNLHASVQNGIVTLSGSVAYYNRKLSVAQKVILVPGVVSICNQIQVEAPKIDDQKLKARLENAIALRAYKDLGGFQAPAPYRITADVNDGVVILLGYAPSQVVSEDAFDVAAEMKGVRFVVNRLSLAIPPVKAQLWPFSAPVQGGLNN